MYIIYSKVVGLTFFSKNISAINPVAHNKKAKNVMTLLLLGFDSLSPESILAKKLIIVPDDQVEMVLLYRQTLRLLMLQKVLLQVARRMLLALLS